MARPVFKKFRRLDGPNRQRTCSDPFFNKLESVIFYPPCVYMELYPTAHNLLRLSQALYQ